MNNLKKQFIEFTLNHEILRFGSFTLNSGRESPYFFNTGLCNDGHLLSSLAGFYSESIITNSLDYDFIFGPAYKGITLATSISKTLYTKHNINKPYCHNRKEAKTHGESGIFVGTKPNGKALIVDDVISSGKSISDSINLLKKNDAQPSSVLVAFDRMEVGNEDRASKELNDDHSVKVYSIITLEDIIDYIKTDNSLSPHLSEMEKYISQYKR